MVFIWDSEELILNHINDMLVVSHHRSLTLKPQAILGHTGWVGRKGEWRPGKTEEMGR